MLHMRHDAEDNNPWSTKTLIEERDYSVITWSGPAGEKSVQYKGGFACKEGIRGV